VYNSLLSSFFNLDVIVQIQLKSLAPYLVWIDLYASDPQPLIMKEVSVVLCGIIRVHTGVKTVGWVYPCTYVGLAPSAACVRILMMLHWRTSD
jgi:hypothetical protein